MEGKWREVEITVYEDLKLIKFEKLFIFKVYKFFSPCSGQLWLCETDETNLAQHFTRNFLIQFVYHKFFDTDLYIL